MTHHAPTASAAQPARTIISAELLTLQSQPNPLGYYAAFRTVARAWRSELAGGAV